MSSDNEQDQHSIWNGRFKANPKEGKFFLEIIDKLGAQFDGMPVEDILQTFWGEPRDVLEKLIKKANKREKKEEAKFDPKELKKPVSANLLFQRDYKEKCDKNGTKFNLKASAEEYKKLSDKEKAKYQKESERLKAEYKEQYENLRAAAIKNGDFPEDKPTRPVSAFIRYLASVRPELTEKFKDAVNRKNISAQISKAGGEMWGALSDKDKAPFEAAYKKEKEASEIKLRAWEEKETQRRKKQCANPAAPAEVKIETGGAATEKAAKPKAKSAAKAAAPAPAPAPAPAAEESDNEPQTTNKVASNVTSDVETEQVEKTVKKSASKAKVVAKANTDSESEEEVKPKKVVSKAKAKPKTLVESDAENDVQAQVSEKEEEVEVKPKAVANKPSASKPKAK